MSEESAAPSPVQAVRAEPDLGIRRFFQVNSTLVQMMSLTFAGAAFLRTLRQDDAVAVLMFLLLVVGVTIFLRLWADLPRQLVVLPGENWTVGLTVVYYCLTIALVIGVGYLLAGFVEQRYNSLGIVLGTALAIGGAALTHHTAVAHRIAGLLRRPFGPVAAQRVAGPVAVGLLVLVVVGAFGLAAIISPLLNAALDQAFGPPQPVAPRR